MNQFYELYSAVYGKTKKVYKQRKTIKEIIYEYTQSISPENYLTNNLLRASKDPSEIYYCQPYFQALFRAIKSLYQEQKLRMSSPLTCYRGGSASDEEIKNYYKNQGQIIQNLGFLSTSTDIQTGENFARNLMFIIEIPQEERDEQLDFGYANIREYSCYPNENQILFNPLNTFQINKVEKRIIKSRSAYQDDRQIDTVYLTYGSLAEIRSKKNKGGTLSISEEQYASQAQYLVIDLKQRVKNQGDAFLSPDDYIQGGLQYWSQQIKHEHHPLKKAQILNKTAMGNRFKGNYQQALDNYERCQEIYERTVGKNHLLYADSLNNIGVIYRNAGRYGEAIKNYQKCLKFLNKIRGVTHLEYADVLNSIGVTYDRMRKYEEALENYEQCLKIKRNSLGESHLSYADTLNNIGITYRNMQKYQEALNVYQGCLFIRAKVLGKSSPSYALTLNNIGGVYHNLGHYQKSLESYQHCLIIREKYLGKDHPSYASTLNNIANTYRQTDKYEEALQLYQTALQISQKCLGINHPQVHTISRNLRRQLIKKNMILSLYWQVFSEDKSDDACPQFSSSL